MFIKQLHGALNDYCVLLVMLTIICVGPDKAFITVCDNWIGHVFVVYGNLSFVRCEFARIHCFFGEGRFLCCYK